MATAVATNGQSKRFALAISNLGLDPSGSTPALFAYGSLLVDAVISTLIDRVPEYEVTTAPGYRVAHLPDKPYPGLVRDESAEAPGRIYRGLSIHEWAILDAWENPVYEVQVVALSGEENALAYVWTADLLKAAPIWTTASMTSTILDDYLKRTKAWREGYEEQIGRFEQR
ncbi:AIG2-like protein [Cytospora mali]|uniref:Putative gamma-glutamylcyclotransferase n=1 Tax=Cytospora mali TaxID=578113 RepID=A0A194UWU1_CYTMA|nr:AIG2-like protein [Valsa mali var. pyri (nom. inval.)]